MVGMRGTGRVVAGGSTDIADTRLYGLLFGGAVAAFCLHTLLGAQPGITTQLLAILGNATCGWSWLLVRALFRRPAARHQWWPPAIVAAMVAAGAIGRLDDDSLTALIRAADNAQNLTSSTLLLLAAIEPLRGIGAMPRAEKRFRLVFSAGYAAMLAVAILWIDGAPAGSTAARFSGAIKASCAMLAVAAMAAAIWYRARHPFTDGAAARTRIPATDHDLGMRILHELRTQRVFALPDLKVADLARRLGEADYKVTQCITGTLGFRNFNHMTNSFRLAEAKRRLDDPAFDHLPILTIALDCGFGSIGPFNRAFKTDAGTTPKQFRAARRSGRADAPNAVNESRR